MIHSSYRDGLLLLEISNGLLINYGYTTTTTITFPLSYTNIPKMLVRPFSTVNSETLAISLSFWYAFNVSVTGSSVYINSTVNKVEWMVIGYLVMDW